MLAIANKLTGLLKFQAKPSKDPTNCTPDTELAPKQLTKVT